MNRQFALSRRVTTIASALLLAGSSVLPILLPSTAKADQLTRRRVEMSTSVVSSSATGDFIFQLPSAVDITGFEIEFTDSPLGNYATLPANVPTIGTPTATLLTGASTGTLCGTAGTACNGDVYQTWDNTGAFTVTGGAPQNGDGYTGGGSPNNQIQLTRATGTSEGQDTGTDVHAIRIGGLTTDNSPDVTFFARMRIYTGGTTTTLAHDGVVAGSTAQVLTVNARVQEVLEFCIGAATTTVVTAWTGTTECTDVVGTSIDLGAIGSSAITTSDTNEGDDSDGIAMLRTNAINGASMVYKSILAGSGVNNRGSLQIAGSTCGVTDLDASESNTDRCFNSDEGGQAFGANIEGFGMRLVNADGASATPTANLTAASPYSSGTDYAWDDDGDSVLVASSTGASEKVIDDEAFQLRFGARSALTTPTGLYSVQAEFIASAVY
jgi:hypothetical protein